MAFTKPLKINSYIVLDLETTGMPSIQFKTKITELSILCLERSHILETHGKGGKNFKPRVMQKLNLCVYPNKLINVGASEVSGLSNELLQNCKPFRDYFSLIHNMISLLEPPTCILAHNGYKFDFPILRSEIAGIGKELPNDIYCADTLPGFRAVLFQNELSQIPLIENYDSDEISELDRTVEMVHANEFEETVDNRSCDDFDWGSESLNTQLNMAAEEAEKRFLLEVQSISMEEKRKINETTPKSSKVKSIKINRIVGKRLFKDDDEMTPKTPLRPKSYRLKDVYSHLTKKEIFNAHQADSDTHALLECVVALGPPFLEWVDQNCMLFNHISKLW